MLMMIWPVLIALVIGYPITRYILRRRDKRGELGATEGHRLAVWIVNSVMALLMGLMVYTNVLEPWVGFGIALVLTVPYTGALCIISAVVGEAMQARRWH